MRFGLYNNYVFPVGLRKLVGNQRVFVFVKQLYAEFVVGVVPAGVFFQKIVFFAGFKVCDMDYAGYFIVVELVFGVLCVLIVHCTLIWFAKIRKIGFPTLSK